MDGLYADIWSHKGYAYIGTYQKPACTRAGFFIVDIGTTIDNFPDTSGAVVAQIKSPPNTRVNDVKVHTVTFQNKTRDMLVLTEEKCGQLTGSGKRQIGKGGISFYDVTDPSSPHAIKQHALDSEIHNTVAWTADDGNSYLIAVDDIELDDVIIVDISKPQSPKIVGRTGISDWIGGAYPQITADDPLSTGVFAAPLLHDVWVEKVDGRWQAVLSYWDAGFVTLDVDDPSNPVVLGDSTYADPDPVYGTSPAEGNGHAAVIGGDQGQFIWAGAGDGDEDEDEDFDPFRTQIVDSDSNGHLASQGDDVPEISPDNSVSGTATYVGLACGTLPTTTNTAAVALIQRGDCSFTEKVQSAEAAGYDAAIVFKFH